MKNKIKCLLLALLMTALVSAPLMARRVSDGKYEFRALTEFEGEVTGSLENIEEETAQSVLNTGDIFLGYDLNSTPPIMGFYYFDPTDATATKMVPWKLLPKNRTDSNGTFLLMSGFVFAPTPIPGSYFRDSDMTGATTYDQYIVGRHYWNLSGDLTYSAGQSDYLIQTLHNGSMTNIFNFDSSANTLTLGTTGTNIIGSTPAANDNDTSLASTAYVQSELTAYAADSGITFSNKTIDADDNTLQDIPYEESWTVYEPVDAMDLLLFKAGRALTITDIDCIVDPAGTGESISLNILECDATGDNCATVDAAITCDNDGAADDGALSNGAIDSGDWVQMVLGAPTGTVTGLTFTIKGKWSY